ncbi:WAT1-related protein At3g28050 isoform X2 [Prunus persica]|uniref:WAT1-related protein At3g28050 isoform X2 n=1 Tax=Prunus persica TaxID=3760 RepID=UPI0009AB4DB9|nr:WAT1-related protein At3g28050 isoform X2 [Prunus persica]
MAMGISMPFVGMVMVILAQVTSLILNKEAMASGLSEYVLAVYSFALAALIILPFCFFFNRSERPPLSFSIISRLFLLSLIGSSGLLMGLAGLNYASATLNTAMLNLIPAFTFILALLFRMEKLNWRSSSSQAKTIGTVVSITGAFVVTFYKGPAVIHARLSSAGTGLFSNLFLFSEKSHWVLGGLLLAADSFSTSLWFIVQASILKKYPAVLITVFFYCFFVCIQCALVSLILVQDLSAWRLKPNIGLLAVLYYRTGPVYVSMFKPLAVVFADVIDVIFLGQALYLGSLIGAAVIISGLYVVIWGKSREEKLHENSGEGQNCLESSTERVPLL